MPDLIARLRWWLLGAALLLVIWTVLAANAKARADEKERAETARDRARSLSHDTHQLTHTVTPLLYGLDKVKEGAPRRAHIEQIEATYPASYRRGVERLIVRYRQRGLKPERTTAETRERGHLNDIRAAMADLNDLVEHVDEEVYAYLSEEENWD